MHRNRTPESTLESLKKEAKRWLKALRANVAEARQRLERAFPGAPAIPGLRDVQHALARERGLAGWTDLKTKLAARASPDSSDVDRLHWFFENACPDHHVRGGRDHVMARHTAMRILSRHPEITRQNLCTAVVCGELEEVERILGERPQAASEKSSVPGPDRAGVGGSGDLFRKDLGPKGWEPLLYLCFTRLPLPAATDSAVAIARALLDHGADPNVYFMAGDSHYTPLVGVIGEGEEDRPPHPQRDALVRLLLERGAEPYDIQVVYNIHFHGHVLWFLELMYEHAVRRGRKADWADPNWSMLDMGGYGSGARWHLDIAVKNNDVRLAEWLLAHGASPNAAPARDPRFPKRTLYEEAVRRGHTEIADLLVHHGAAPTAVVLDGIDAFVDACLRLDREKARTLVEEHPEYLRFPEALFAAAKRDRADVAQLLLDLGVSPDVEDANGTRALHQAAYADASRVVALLLERGAEVDPRDSNHGGTPLGWAVYGGKRRPTELLARLSRDVFELAYIGHVERLREVLSEEPEGARIVAGGHTPLMWLPPDDESRAIEVARLFLAHGADPSLKNTEGQTAADRAERLGMLDVADVLRRKG